MEEDVLVESDGPPTIMDTQGLGAGVSPDGFSFGYGTDTGGTGAHARDLGTGRFEDEVDTGHDMLRSPTMLVEDQEMQPVLPVRLDILLGDADTPAEDSSPLGHHTPHEASRRTASSTPTAASSTTAATVARPSVSAPLTQALNATTSNTTAATVARPSVSAPSTQATTSNTAAATVARPSVSAPSTTTLSTTTSKTTTATVAKPSVSASSTQAATTPTTVTTGIPSASATISTTSHSPTSLSHTGKGTVAAASPSAPGSHKPSSALPRGTSSSKKGPSTSTQEARGGTSIALVSAGTPVFTTATKSNHTGGVVETTPTKTTPITTPTHLPKSPTEDRNVRRLQEDDIDLNVCMTCTYAQ